MSNNQEGTFTKVPNELIENICKSKLNGTQFKIILMVARYTFGFHRDDHKLSETFIAKATNIHKKQIAREIKSLVLSNMLIVTSQPTFNSSRRLKLNTDFPAWECSQLAETLPGSENVTPTGSENVTPTGSENVNQERNNIKKERKKETCAFFGDLWALYPNKKGMTKVTAKAKKELDKLGFDKMSACINRYINNKPDWQQYQNGSTFFNSGYLDYLEDEATETEPIHDLPVITMEDLERIQSQPFRSAEEIKSKTLEELLSS